MFEALGKICKNTVLFKGEGDFKKCAVVCFQKFYLRADSFMREKLLIKDNILNQECKNS